MQEYVTHRWHKSDERKCTVPGPHIWRTASKSGVGKDRIATIWMFHPNLNVVVPVCIHRKGPV